MVERYTIFGGVFKKVGTVKENKDLKQTYVLLSAFKDEGSIIPVQLEVKEFWNNEPRLYLTVALSKIKSEVLENPAATLSGGADFLFSDSTYKLSDIFAHVNPIDERFLKYVPDDFLNTEQKKAKRKAIELNDTPFLEEYSSDVSSTSSRTEFLVSVLPFFSLSGIFETEVPLVGRAVT